MDDSLIPDQEVLAALDETLLASAGRIPLVIEFDRELTPDDLPELEANMAPAESRPAGPIERLRYSHHQLARYMARGLTPQEISGLTGYSPPYIRRLEEDPTFRELLAGYSTERDIAFSETLERMKTLGISALDELQRRMDDEPEAWSRREVMELAKLMLIEPGRQAPGPAGGPAIAIAVSFVSPEPGASSRPSAPTIEMEPNP